jgi:ribosome biogenesis protein UTP30
VSLLRYLPGVSIADKPPFSSIRIATPEHTSAAQTLENLLAATPAVVALIQDGWENVLSIGIKTSTSVLLPIYSAQLEGRFAIPPKSDEDGDVSMSAAESKKNRRKGKGKDEKNASVKRPAEEVAEVAPTKEKKAKATAESPAKKAKTLPTPETKKDAAPSALTKVKKVAAPSDSPSKADKVVKKTGKKSSSLGTGSAGKKAKQAVLGRSK